MDPFFGSWKLDNSVNFEAFLKELEINYVMRKLAFLVVPIVVFKPDPNNTSTLSVPPDLLFFNSDGTLGSSSGVHRTQILRLHKIIPQAIGITWQLRLIRQCIQKGIVTFNSGSYPFRCILTFGNQLVEPPFGSIDHD